LPGPTLENHCNVQSLPPLLQMPEGPMRFGNGFSFFDSVLQVLASQEEMNA
jgi:hypothetical protein